MPRFEVVTQQEAIQRAVPSRRQQVLQEYLGYIERLGTGQAGKLTVGEGETSLTVRRRLTLAAKEYGKRIKVNRIGNEVYFWIEARALPPGRRRGRPVRRSSSATASHQPEDFAVEREAIEGIRRGLEQMDRGEGQPAEEAFAAFRGRHGIMNG